MPRLKRKLFPEKPTKIESVTLISAFKTKLHNFGVLSSQNSENLKKGPIILKLYDYHLVELCGQPRSATFITIIQ